MQESGAHVGPEAHGEWSHGGDADENYGEGAFDEGEIQGGYALIWACVLVDMNRRTRSM